MDLEKLKVVDDWIKEAKKGKFSTPVFVGGHSFIGIVNIFVFQWFFIRACYNQKNNGEFRYGFLYPVIPLSGWWGPFVPRRHRIFWFFNK